MEVQKLVGETTSSRHIYSVVIGIRILAGVLRYGMAVILVYSGLIHISGPYFFLESLLGYRIVPASASVFVATFTMHLVSMSGICVVSGAFRPGVYALTGVMFASFVSVQLFAATFGKPVSCGCFGPSDQPIGWKTISIPAILFFVSVCLFFFDRPNATSVAISRK